LRVKIILLRHAKGVTTVDRAITITIKITIISEEDRIRIEVDRG